MFTYFNLDSVYKSIIYKYSLVGPFVHSFIHLLLTFKLCYKMADDKSLPVILDGTFFKIIQEKGPFSS